jgi:hypothetical protein
MLSDEIDFRPRRSLMADRASRDTLPGRNPPSAIFPPCKYLCAATVRGDPTSPPEFWSSWRNRLRFALALATGKSGSLSGEQTVESSRLSNQFFMGKRCDMIHPE